MDWLRWITAAASVATAVGVLLAGWQIRVAKQFARTQFEDELSNQYRSIIQRIPVKALLGHELEPAEFEGALDALYAYIHLSNRQVFLRRTNRVSKQTWEEWRGGIKVHLARPAFRKAWTLFKEQSPETFRELQRVEDEAFNSDPQQW